MTEPILLSQQLCFAFYRTHKAFNRFYAQALAPFKLTYAQYIVLLVLYEQGTLSVKELGENVGLDSGTLTPLLRRLEKDGWIQRQRNVYDERRLDIVLTKSAQAKKESLFSRVQGCAKVLDLPSADYQRMMTDVAMLANRVEQGTEKLADEAE
ncbi:MarR family winged helix-turn-helix transcriptional regulator [Lapidilactobacillus luobeiensis]|uniref:MarR family winged helix-turn-helix transcriptional regulator n=1 Tax=Lapidilactobacillus luobeiensis TaxID=2950371 RepID=UPI0021C319CC|nr:MarR family transcriptional regulator [Lapidilactobacillus luobeiensis]